MENWEKFEFKNSDHNVERTFDVSFIFFDLLITFIWIGILVFYERLLILA